MACFVCGNNMGNQTPVLVGGTDTGGLRVDCKFCGTFFVEDNAHTAINDSSKIKDRQQWKSSIVAYLVHKNLLGLGTTFIVDETSVIPRAIPYSPTSIQQILDWFQCPISERLDRALQNLMACTRKLGGLGTTVQVNVREDYPLMLAETPREAFFLLGALCEKDYVKDPHAGTTPFHRWSSGDIDTFIASGAGKINILLKEKGLAHLDELERQRPRSNKAFIAMWFPKPGDPQRKLLDDVYANGFSKAIKEAGYDPIRIDKEEFLGRIDDEIIANIRQSRFVVADFTGQRGGVYYEAGFAHGLGVPVIFTCEKKYFEAHKVHFDTRQYNHLVWTDPSDLHEKLLNRIRATIV